MGLLHSIIDSLVCKSATVMTRKQASLQNQQVTPAETPDSKKNRGQHSKAAEPWSGTLQRHQQPSSKAQTAQTALWQQHLSAAPCSGTSKQVPKRKQHSDSSTAGSCSSTLQQPSSKAQSANSSLTAAPCSGTLQRHQQPSSKAQAALWQQHSNQAQHSDSSTFQQHPAAAPLQSARTALTAPAAHPNTQTAPWSSTMQWHQHPQATPCTGSLQVRSKAHAPIWQQHPQWHPAPAEASSSSTF